MNIRILSKTIEKNKRRFSVKEALQRVLKDENDVDSQII